VNCVARTGLKACEDDTETAFQVNTVFAQKLCAVTKMLGVDHFQFGTEYAFACDTEGKTYAEDDTNAPSTAYGLTKYLGEPQKSDTSSFTLRLPLLYGPTHDAQIVGAMLTKLRNGETVRVADDVYSTPVCSIDVAKFLGDAICSEARLPSLVHLGSEQLLSLFETVHAFAAHLECTENLLPAKSNDFVPDGSKPRFGGLVSSHVAALPSIGDRLGTL
jgi:dTDP-4-dehydrorhamnose reductase